MSVGNLKIYNSPAVLSWYKKLKSLVPAEKIVFQNYHDLLASGKVLDIGIGGGRTTDHLLGISADYTGIDYSEGFVDIVRREYPGAALYVMDARDLSAFRENTFSFVNFSFNGIDYVNYDDRKKIFSEIYRVLNPGGVFFFSTHNMVHASFGKTPWSDSTQSLFTNFKTFIRLLPFYPRHFLNRKKEIYEKEYAIINDSAHNYSLLTFYTTPDFLSDQLSVAGYNEIKFFSKKGNPFEYASLDDWIFITCKKPAF